MTWAKFHADARYNLANSGLLGCELDDLPVAAGEVAINGLNTEGYVPLKEAIAARYGVVPECVVTAQGTSMANFLTLATILERGDEVLIERPVYDPLLAAAHYLGAEVRRIERRFEQGYQLDLDEVRRLISPRTRLIVLTSPHNPSGVVLEPEALRGVGALAASVGARVLVDEVYRDILGIHAPPSNVHFGPHFVATSSLTKSYGLSGLRCGWILCEPRLAERMRRLNDLFGAVGSMPSESLALAAFRRLDRLAERARAIMDPNIELVLDFLRAQTETLECVVPPRSMVVFPRLRGGVDSEVLHDRLRRAETSVVPGKYFEDARHFRLGFAVRTEDVAAGLGHLSQALQELNREAGGRSA